MIQPLLNQQPDNPIRIKQEIPAFGFFIADDGVQCFELRRLGEGEDGGGEGIEVVAVYVGLVGWLWWWEGDGHGSRESEERERYGL